MNAIGRLTREHEFLRAKLRVLEAALGMREQAWCTVREVSFTLWKELQAHGRREEAIFVTFRAAWGEGPWTPVMVDHAAEPGDVLVMKRLWMEPPHSLETFRPKFTEVMARLCRHMDQQEALLFPWLEHLLTRRDPMALTAQPVRSALTETMRVSDVINRYPKTQGTFEALFIDRRSEGYDCLDEVAWRHSMESHDLLTALDEVVAHSAAPSGDDQEPAEVLAPSGA